MSVTSIVLIFHDFMNTTHCTIRSSFNLTPFVFKQGTYKKNNRIVYIIIVLHLLVKMAASHSKHTHFCFTFAFTQQLLNSAH